MQMVKILKKSQMSIKAIFSRFKAFLSKVDEDTVPKKKRSYLDDMAIPRENLRSQYGGYNPTWKSGAILIFTLGIMMIFQGCKPKQVVVEKDNYIYITKDSTVYKDSVVYVPVEVYKDYSRLDDTLVLETSLAKAVAWNDTVAWMLNGFIENKQAVQYQIVEVDKWHTKDSIVEKEVPVPYEVEVVKTHIPTWAWLCLVWSLVCIGFAAWKFYKRIML